METTELIRRGFCLGCRRPVPAPWATRYFTALGFCRDTRLCWRCLGTLLLRSTLLEPAHNRVHSLQVQWLRPPYWRW